MKRLVLSLIVVSFLAVAAGYALAFAPGAPQAWAPWCLALGTNGALTSLMALGALRRGRIAPAQRWTFVGTFALCSIAFGAALALPPAEGPHGPLLFGLPLRAAIIIYGVGIAPLLVLPFVWARTFEGATLGEEDLRRLRAAHEAMTRGADASGSAGAGV